MAIVHIDSGQLANPTEQRALTLTTSALSNGQTFTGSWLPVGEYASCFVSIVGAPQTAQGTLTIQFGYDGSTATSTIPVPINDLVTQVPYRLVITAPWLKVSYTNGDDSQTSFAIRLVLNRIAKGPLTRGVRQVIGAAEPIFINRSIIEPSSYGDQTILGAKRALHGDATTSVRVSQIEVFGTLPIASNPVTTNMTGSGAIAQGSDVIQISTGTGAAGFAQVETERTLVPSPGHETWFKVEAAFTTPTDANSEQRIGIFDDDEGLFVGVNDADGLFLARRRGGSDTRIPFVEFDEDPLDGTGSTLFGKHTRSQALDYTKLNEYCIRASGGNGVIVLDVMSPEGRWVRAHTIDLPNSSVTRLVGSLRLPMRAEVEKSSADATDIVLTTGDWSCGTTEDASSFSPDQIKARTKIEHVTLAATSDSTVYTVPTGRQFRAVDIIISATSTSASGGQIVIRDGTSDTGDPVFAFEIAPLSGTTRAEVNTSHSFKIPPTFATGVFLDLPALGSGSASFTITGYLEPAT